MVKSLVITCFNILTASQAKKLKCFFTYQAVVNDAWFGKDDHNGAVPTHSKARLFEDRQSFLKS